MREILAKIACMLFSTAVILVVIIPLVGLYFTAEWFRWWGVNNRVNAWVDVVFDWASDRCDSMERWGGVPPGW